MILATVQSFSSPAQSRRETRPMVDPVGEGAISDDIRKLLYAIRKRIHVGLVAFLIFSIVLATAGFVASYDSRRRTDAFESDGRPAIATITRKYTRSLDRDFWTRAFSANSDDQMYLVEFCFRLQDKEYHCGTIGVSGRTYDGLGVGSPLRITYVSWRPDWFYVGDEAPDDRDSDIFARLFQFCTIAVLLTIIVIAAMVFWQLGGSMAGQPASESQANDVALRFRQRHGYARRR